jgi:ferredoxin
MLKKRFVVRFPADSSNKPLTYHLIRDFDLKINILKATIDEGQEGRLLIEIEADKDNVEAGIKFLKDEGVTVVPIEKQLHLDQDKCVHCGACTAVCFTNALSLNRETWELDFAKDKCVVCGLCVKACPIKIIEIGF